MIHTSTKNEQAVYSSTAQQGCTRIEQLIGGKTEGIDKSDTDVRPTPSSKLQWIKPAYQVVELGSEVTAYLYQD